MTDQKESIIVSKDDELEVRVGGNVEQAPIRLCEEHHLKLVHNIQLQGLGHMIAQTEEELSEKIRNQIFEPLITATDALMRLSLKTIGSVGVIEHGGCPVCALNRFDFVEHIADLIGAQVRAKTGVKTQ